MNGREKYIASKAYRRPVGQFTQQDNVRDFARSGPGQNYFAMQDLQRQAPSFQKGDPRIDELKQRRRLWNRAQKYPAGEILGRTPQDQMEQYRGLSRDLRETAPGAFGQMYPLTSAYHKYTDVGGLAGLALKSGANILKGVGDFGANVYDSVMEAAGIGGAIPSEEATPEILKNYAEKTFPFYPSDVHSGTAYNYEHPEEMELYDEAEEVYGGPRPHEDMRYLSDEAAAIQKEFDTNPYFKDLAGENVVLPFEKERRGHPHLETYVPGGMLDEPTGRTLVDVIDEPLPFDDSGREAGIASLYDQGTQWGETNRRYENEYRDYAEQLGNMPGGPMAYEEFARAYERIHQGKPHAGLR